MPQQVTIENSEQGLQREEDLPHVVIRVEEVCHAGDILKLTNEAFGPGRFAKTAERIREHSDVIKDLSFVACRGSEVVGSVRLWSIKIMLSSGDVIDRVAFLGPIVVSPDVGRVGLGKQLVRTAIDMAVKHSYNAIVLVGALSYFGQLGFKIASNLELGGPVAPDRLLIQSFNEKNLYEGRIV